MLRLSPQVTVNLSTAEIQEGSDLEVVDNLALAGFVQRISVEAVGDS